MHNATQRPDNQKKKSVDDIHLEYWMNAADNKIQMMDRRTEQE
jgi:hypothetical protein